MKSRRLAIHDDEDDVRIGKPNRSGSDADLDITPMIDVTFLLLIFFMVSSTMQSKPDLDVPAAAHGVGVEARGATLIVISGRAGVDPVIRLPDVDGATLDDVRTAVETGLKSHQREEVIVKADREVPHGFVQEVIKAVQDVEGIRFSIGVRDPHEK